MVFTELNIAFGRKEISCAEMDIMECTHAVTHAYVLVLLDNGKPHFLGSY